MENKQDTFASESEAYLLTPQWESMTNKLLLPNHQYEQINPTPIEPITENLDAFQCGIGHGNDLKIVKQYDEEYREWFDVTSKVYGYRQHLVKQYPAVRFSYRLKATGTNHVPTTEGFATVQLKAAPIETVSYTVVKYAIRTVSINVRIRFEVEYYELSEGSSELKVKKQTLYTNPFKIELAQTIEQDEETGTYSLAYIERTQCTQQTILQLIREKALSIPSIAHSQQYYGINFYGVTIEDDYAFDIGTDSVRYHHEKVRNFEISTYGTFKVTADVSNNEYDLNSYLYYEGFANEGFFITRQTLTTEINVLDGQEYVLFTRQDLNNLPLINIDDSTETLETTNFKWNIIEETKGSTVTLECPTQGDSLLIARLQACYESDTLTYYFDDTDTYVSIPFYKIISDMPYHLTQQFKFQVKVLNQTSNIKIMEESIAIGDSIFVIGTAAKRFKMLSQFGEREEAWEYLYPASNEPGLDGVVNGDFIHLPDGKRDYEVYAPTIAIPDTVDQVLYQIEFDLSSETEHSVQAKFEHETGSGFGYENNDKVTFSSNVYYYVTKDVKDFLFENVTKDLEIEDLNSTLYQISLTRPDLLFTYNHYELELHSSNKDVKLLDYPTTLQFINNQCDISFSARIQQNATGRWSPKIHNGFYYLNQHEYYMPSRFQVDGDFIDETYYETGPVALTVQLECVDDEMNYQEHELQFGSELDFKYDLDDFIFEEGMLHPKPIIETPYYKEYQYREYYSPVIEMPNQIVEWKELEFKTQAEHGAIVRVYARVKKVEGEGWHEWVQCFSGEPMPLQEGTFVQFKVEFTPYHLEDTSYIDEVDCCGYSFRKIYSEDSTNIDLSEGIIKGLNDSFEACYLTTVLDYGTTTHLRLSGSGSSSQIKYYIATSEDQAKLANPTWQSVKANDRIATSRYARFKVVIPPGEELYLLYRKAEITLTNVGVMGIGDFIIRGTSYVSQREANIVQAYDYTIPYDNQAHIVSVTLKKLLRPLLEGNGYTFSHLHYFTLTSNDDLTEVVYDSEDLMTPVTIRRLETQLSKFQTPAIKFYGNKTVLKGIPQQFSPLIIETEDYGPLREVFFKGEEGKPTLRHKEVFTSKGQRIFPLQFLDYDFDTIEIEIEEYNNDSRNFIYYSKENDNHYVYISRESEDFIDPTFLYVRLLSEQEVKETTYYHKEMNMRGLFYGKYNYFLEFNQWIPEDATVKISYCLRNSFVTLLDEEAGTIRIIANTDEPIEQAYISYETNQHNHSKTLDHLSLNPIFNNRYDGFIYLTYDTFAPSSMEIHASHTLLRSKVEDKVYIYLRLLDENSNPVPNETIQVDGNIGTVTASSVKTDVNGVISFVYNSPKGSGDDKIRFTCPSNGLQNTLKIKIV